MFLDSKLDFKEHIENVFNKVSKAIGLLQKLQRILPRPLFIRSHLDYGDIIYDQGGICHSNYIYVKANNKCMTKYDKNKRTVISSILACI